MGEADPGPVYHDASGYSVCGSPPFSIMSRWEKPESTDLTNVGGGQGG